MFSFLSSLSEAATTAVQAVIFPTAAVSIAVAAMALMPRRFVTQQQAATLLDVTDERFGTRSPRVGSLAIGCLVAGPFELILMKSSG